MASDHLDDDALSASLDGEATPAELAHLDGCDVCGERAGELRRAATLIGGPVPTPGGDRREAAIRTAVAAAPTDLATRRRTMPPWLAAAAALLVLLAVGGLLLQVSGGDGDDEDTAASTLDAESEFSTESELKDEAAGDAGGGSGAQESAPGPATAAAPAPGASAFEGEDVGSLDGELLRAAVEQRVVRGAERGAGADDDATTSTTAAAPCEADLRAANGGLGAVRLVARGTLEGAEALLVVFDELEGGAVRAFVVAPADCRVLRSESVPTT